jgi:hypothetical protein
VCAVVHACICTTSSLIFLALTAEVLYVDFRIKTVDSMDVISLSLYHAYFNNLAQ